MCGLEKTQLTRQSTKQVSTLKGDATDEIMWKPRKCGCSVSVRVPAAVVLVIHNDTHSVGRNTSYLNWHCPCAGQEHTLGYVGGI